MSPRHFFLCALVAVTLPFPARGSEPVVLPQKITLNVDCVLPVPFAVTETIQPVQAGTEVNVKSVHGEQVRVAHGVGEGLVPIADTNFKERAALAEKEAAAARARAKANPPDTQATPAPNPFDKVLRDMQSVANTSTDLLVLSWRWGPSAGGNFFQAVGEIRNVSGRRLELVEVEVTTRDASGNVVNSETSTVNDSNLEPNQDTRFSVMIRQKGGEQSAGLAFRKMFGDRYSHREK